MIILGVDTSALPRQFDSSVQGRVLILDGDGPCYVAAATVKRLDTAVRRFQQSVLRDMFMAGAESCRIHLTAHNSKKFGRHKVIAAKDYQANRVNKAKPSLLEPLREAIADNSTWLDEYNVTLHREIEADDGMMQDAYSLKENGVIKSEDKDLRMTPYPYYEEKRGQVLPSQPEGWISITHTPTGAPKLVGQGPIFFWAQMLMGDTADNVQGVKLYKGKKIGTVGAYEVLGEVKTVQEAANTVIDAYRAIDQNVVAEGWLLWLTRTFDDNVLKYFSELDLSKENREFVHDCSLRKWVRDDTN